MYRITMDFETRSLSNLKKEGAIKYSLDPTTQPTCLAFKERGLPKLYFLPFETINTPWKKLPEDFKIKWKSSIYLEYEFSAHNALFERAIYENILVARYGWPSIPVKKWRCTAAKAAACALPRSLDGAGEALRLTTQKDKRGYAAMMATCKPTKQYNAWKKARQEIALGKKVGPKKKALAEKNQPPMFLEYRHNAETWDTLYRYCKIDVKTEELLDDTLPDLTPSEQEIWHLNQTLNWRGLRVDIPTIKKIVSIMEKETKVKLKELDKLTLGLVTKAGARKSILEFLALDDIILPDIRATTVEDVLKGGNLSEEMRRLLEIRKALSKTSTKKYQAFLDRALANGYCGDILLYHGASPGRDTGKGLQPHNFPKGVLDVDKDRPYGAVEDVIKFDEEELNFFYGSSLAILFSSILRNMILPDEGHDMYVADFSKIEVAVLWWLSGNEAGLKVLNSGKDPYLYQASKNTGKGYDDIDELERALGKAQVLGCGFGLGAKKFKLIAFDQYRLKLTTKQSREAVKIYREANSAVPKLWSDYEKAAIKAVEENVTVKTGKCKFFTQDKFLWIELPSGRRIAYREPQISWRVREYEQLLVDDDGEPLLDNKGNERFITKFTEPKKTLEFWAVNSRTKKWAIERTWGGTLAENITQAVARDLMMPAMVRFEKRGYKALLMVHDEGICSRKKGEGSFEEFLSIMLERPVWADKHLPLDAKGWVGPRYRK